MTYAVKETFLTLQGEGRHAGRRAVFLRFARCNLWTGREEDRSGAQCSFCDTDFVGVDGPGGGLFRSAGLLADHVAQLWGNPPGSRSASESKFVVCTGGEPLLQLDSELISELAARGFEIAIETNGTIAVPSGIDWVCVSPKAGTDLIAVRGDELKVVFPQLGLDMAQLGELDFDHFLVSPMDGPERGRCQQAAIDFCLNNPKWRLSLQTHKFLGIR